jgi:hypothetical protein
MNSNDLAAAAADALARCTGATRVTVIEERRELDGTLTETARASSFRCGEYAGCGQEDGEDTHSRACQEENGIRFSPLLSSPSFL